MNAGLKVLIVAIVAAAVVAVVVVKRGSQNGDVPSTVVATPPGDASLSTAVPDGEPAAQESALTVESDAEPAGLPKLLELGSTSCIPCKRMAPILEDLRTEHAGKLEVEFIDIYADEASALKHEVDVIPTQIFFDADGRELYRHIGFYAKDDILAKWAELGVELEPEG